MVSVNCMFAWSSFCILLYGEGAGSLQMTFPRISCQLASCQVLLMGVLIGICKVEEGRAASHPASCFWQSVRWWEQQEQWQASSGDSTATPDSIGGSYSVSHGSNPAKGAALWWILNRMWQHRQRFISRCKLLGSSLEVSANFWSLGITLSSFLLLLIIFCLLLVQHLYNQFPVLNPL